MKQNHSTSESLKSLESLRSHLQALGENSQTLSMIDSLEKIFMQHAVADKNKQQKIDKLTIR